MTNAMKFNDYFLFTQYSLATFENCPLKFKKRYLESLKWDSFPDEEIKRRLNMGRDFHLLAQRYFMGVDTSLEEFTEDAGELSIWLESLKKSFRIEDEASYLPEYKLRMSHNDLKLEANFDLIILRDGCIEIWDWKTHSGKESSGKVNHASKLAGSLQTMVYMYVLKEQVSLVAGKDIECDRISMCYWQPTPARVLAKVNYSDSLHESFRQAIGTRIRNILTYDYSNFEKELYSKHCRYCEFNWFCNNEKVDFLAMEEEPDVLEELDWDDVEERF